MQASLSLAAQRSPRHVADKSSRTFVKALQSSRVDSPCLPPRQLLRLWYRGPTIVTRSLSSGAVGNHLRDVKDYTAANLVSIWKSSSNNPYENLAIENYILKHSDPASKVLFTYVNWPCVVIGRNQNPWLECNLARMQQGLPHHQLSDKEEDGNNTISTSRQFFKDGELVPLDLVRRRSGGGTVIHDAGNLNFSFIVPNDKNFSRDKHAKLVVSMLENLRAKQSMKPFYRSVRVNKRHDIVMKRDTSRVEDATKEFKVSGSAFKLTRGRALHHGTILHSSPNIIDSTEAKCNGRSVFSEVLTSPAKAYLDAKGVGSVRSPVHNLFKADNASDRLTYSKVLQKELQKAFQSENEVNDIEVQEVSGVDCTEDSNKQIFDDIQEMLTDEWRFCQTPSFDFYSPVSSGATIQFQVKHGIISTILVKDSKGESAKDYESMAMLDGMELHKIDDWSRFLAAKTEATASVVAHLTKVFPKVAPTRCDAEETVGQLAEDMVETKKMGEEEVVVIERSADGSVEAETEGENLVVQR